MRTPFRQVFNARVSIARVTVALVAAIAATALAQQPLRLVSTPWSPFTNAPGQPRFALDLVEAALTRIGMPAQTSIVVPTDFTLALLSGPYDGSAAAWKDAERERVLIYSQAYLENRLVLVGASGADVSAATLADLKGKRVAIVEGYAYGEAFEQSGPLFVRSRSDEDSITRLLAGAVDYTLVDDLVIQYIVDTYPKEAASRLAIGKVPLVIRPLHFTIHRTRPDAADIIARFNAQLRGMITDRTYHRLLHVDWIGADVNGDGIAENVPVTDHAGPTPPQRVYKLFTDQEAKELIPTRSGFYFGGSLYGDWASVPDSYKDVNPNPPDSRRSSGSILTIRW